MTRPRAENYVHWANRRFSRHIYYILYWTLRLSYSGSLSSHTKLLVRAIPMQLYLDNRALPLSLDRGSKRRSRLHLPVDQWAHVYPFQNLSFAKKEG